MTDSSDRGIEPTKLLLQAIRHWWKTYGGEERTDHFDPDVPLLLNRRRSRALIGIYYNHAAFNTAFGAAQFVARRNGFEKFKLGDVVGLQFEDDAQRYEDYYKIMVFHDRYFSKEWKVAFHQDYPVGEVSESSLPRILDDLRMIDPSIQQITAQWNLGQLTSFTLRRLLERQQYIAAEAGLGSDDGTDRRLNDFRRNRDAGRNVARGVRQESRSAGTETRDALGRRRDRTIGSGRDIDL
jgi:hypothetical protein